MRYLLCLVAAIGFAANSEMTLTVDQLTTFIRSAIQLKQPDKQVAETLHHVKMSEKLVDRTIEELEGLGAGPKTIVALNELREASAKLAAAVPPPPKPVVVPIPGPDSIEQGKIIDAARDYVMNYTKQLPNFICLQVTRRQADPTGTEEHWRSVDTVTTKLSYNDQKEDYQVVLVNNQPVTNMTMEKLGGTVSMGEFGSMMKEIFDRHSQARFEWDHWATLRSRRTYVFSYDIEQVNSQYRMLADKTMEIVAAYRGLVFIDKDTNMVTKITLNPYDIPSTFPIRDVKESLDYGLTAIGDAQFMLPLKAELVSRRSGYLTKNEIEFRLYRKFGTESTIKFDTPDALPDDQTKEKPVEPKKKP